MVFVSYVSRFNSASLDPLYLSLSLLLAGSLHSLPLPLWMCPSLSFLLLFPLFFRSFAFPRLLFGKSNKWASKFGIHARTHTQLSRMMRMFSFGSYKLDGLSDFTYTRLCRRSASRPARTHSPFTRSFFCSARIRDCRRSRS